MATFDFKSPDGKTYSVNGPDGATQAQAFTILQQQHPELKTTPPEKAEKAEEPSATSQFLHGAGEVARGGLEQSPLGAAGDVMGGAYNVGREAVGGLAGAAGAVLPGPPGQGAAWQQKTEAAIPAYTPVNQTLKAGGEAATHAVAAIPGVHQADAWLAQHPIASAGVNAATQILPLAAGGLAGRVAGAGEEAAAGAELPAPRSVPHEPSQVLRNAAREGYTFRPSDIQAANPTAEVPGLTAERMADSSAQAKLHTANNQVQTTRLGGQVVGKTNATEVTPEDVVKANKAPGAAYDDAGIKAGAFQATPKFIDAAAAVKDSPIADQAGVAKVLQAAQRGDVLNGPEFVKVLNEVRQRGAYDLSNAMEDELERQLSTKYGGEAGQAILKNVRDARQQFAQNYLVRDSLKGGQVDASVVNAYDKANPGVLDNELATIARTHDMAPDVTGMPSAGIGKINNPYASHPGLVRAGLNAVERPIGRAMLPSQKTLTGETPLPAVPTEPFKGPIAAKDLPPPPAALAPPPGEVGAAPKQGEMSLPESQWTAYQREHMQQHMHNLKAGRPSPQAYLNALRGTPTEPQ